MPSAQEDRETLRVALVQCAPLWENRDSTLVRLDALLGGLVGQELDLVVLPEMFTTGFSMAVERTAEPVDELPTVAWMHNWARHLKAAVAGSLPVRDGERYFNRLYVVTPGGGVAHYDKHFLFTLSAEPQVFTAGRERVVVRWRGWSFLLAVCFDLRFPVWLRNIGRWDCLLVVASWPAVRRDAWRLLLGARAVENQYFVVGVNRVGHDGNCVYYAGDSQVIAPDGRVLVWLQHKEEVAVVAIEKGLIQEVRRSLPFLDSMERFSLSVPVRVVCLES